MGLRVLNMLRSCMYLDNPKHNVAGASKFGPAVAARQVKLEEPAPSPVDEPDNATPLASVPSSLPSELGISLALQVCAIQEVMEMKPPEPPSPPTA